MTRLQQARVSANSADFSRSPFARLAAPLTLLAGVGFVATQLVMLARIGSFDTADPGWRAMLIADPLYQAAGVVYFGVFCVMVLAPIAVYLRMANPTGKFWALGVGAATVGSVNLGGNFWFEAFATPWIGAVAPGALLAGPSGLLVAGGFASYILFTLGWVLFGAAGYRARVIPLPIALVLIVGGLIAFNASPPYGVPLGLGLAWLGAWMMSSVAPRAVEGTATS